VVDGLFLTYPFNDSSITDLFNLIGEFMNEELRKQFEKILNNTQRKDLIIIANSWIGNRGFDDKSTTSENIIKLILDSMGF
jgi:hypothetical protein